MKSRLGSKSCNNGRESNCSLPMWEKKKSCKYLVYNEWCQVHGSDMRDIHFPFKEVLCLATKLVPSVGNLQPLIPSGFCLSCGVPLCLQSHPFWVSPLLEKKSLDVSERWRTFLREMHIPEFLSKVVEAELQFIFFLCSVLLLLLLHLFISNVCCVPQFPSQTWLPRNLTDSRWW